MSGRTYSDEVLQEAARLKLSGLTIRQCAEQAKCAKSSMESRIKAAALRGLMLTHPPAMPGFEISKVSIAPNGGKHITQKQEHGPVFEMPRTHFLGKMTVNRGPEGRVIQDWIRAEPDAVAREAALRAVVDALKEELPRAEPVSAPPARRIDLLNQYTVTDLHFRKLSWWEEATSELQSPNQLQLRLLLVTKKIKPSPHSAT